jgi:hypothetical protein
MADNILTATVAQVPFGIIEIEGLLLEDGSFAVAQQQVATLFQVIPTSAPKWLKTLLGKECRLFRVKTNRGLTEGKRIRSSENALSINQFERVLRLLDRKGNKLAEEMIDSLLGLSLTQLFSDAFKVKFEQAERQEYLITRQATKDSFWYLTDDIKAYIDKYGSSCPKYHYINSFKVMSIGLFGKPPATIKEELNIAKEDLNRDHFGNESLRRIDMVQRLARVSIQNNERPSDAVIQAINAFQFVPIDYKN